MKHLRNAMRGACALATLVLLTACGSGSGSTANNPPAGNDNPQTIAGIATPDSVAVVTATNAN